MVGSANQVNSTIDAPDAEDPAHEPRGGRDVSNELGLPSVRGHDLREVTPAEREAYERRVEAEAAAQFDQSLREAEDGGLLGSLFGGLAKVYFAAGLTFAALLAFFVYAQTLQILAHLAVQPDWIRYSGYAVLGLLAAIVAACLARFAWTYGRYRYIERVSLHELHALAERSELRELARRRSADAVSRLKKYLRGYELSKPARAEALGRLGLDVPKLREARDWLLDDANYASANEWIGEFRERFQTVLDAAADARLTAYWKRVGVGTAASPNGLVDSAIVLASCFAFLADLCAIYNLRLSKRASVNVLAWSFANTYVAGQADEVGDYLADASTMFGDAATGVVADVLRKFAAKTMEGAANGLLMRRLGKQAIRLLQPVGEK